MIEGLEWLEMPLKLLQGLKLGLEAFTLELNLLRIEFVMLVWMPIIKLILFCHSYYGRHFVNRFAFELS